MIRAYFRTRVGHLRSVWLSVPLDGETIADVVVVIICIVGAIVGVAVSR